MQVCRERCSVLLLPVQLLTVCDACPGLEEGEMDSTALLNEILGGMSVTESDFTSEWMDVFGHASGKSEATQGAIEDEHQEPAFFLPSQLLDQSPGQLQSSFSGQNLNLSVYQAQFLRGILTFLMSTSHSPAFITSMSSCNWLLFLFVCSYFGRQFAALATTTRQLILKTDVLLSLKN